MVTMKVCDSLSAGKFNALLNLVARHLSVLKARVTVYETVFAQFCIAQFENVLWTSIMNHIEDLPLHSEKIINR